MNAQESDRIGSLVHELRDAGLTVLMVEHNVRLVIEFCDNVAVVNFGRLLVQGSPAHCIEHPDVQQAYFGKSGDAERIKSFR
jgi:branched-chain amino acid transport system ATP-binding protein